jgi:F-type H+-transporting ATPase subunit b
LSQATDEAKGERERLLDQARRDANALRVERQDALKREQQHLNVEIARRTREEVYAIARKALTDLAGISLEARISEVFTRRLRALDHGTKDDFVAAVKTSSEPVMVRSAFELSAEQRDAIQTELNSVLSAEIPIRFEAVPDVIGGIELSAKGRKIAWSIADYLGSLEKSVGDLLVPSTPQIKIEPEPQSGARSAAREQTE